MRKSAVFAINSALLSLLLFSCASDSSSRWKMVGRTEKGPSVGAESGNLKVSFLNEKIGAAVNNGNHFFYTEDAGRNWRDTAIDTNPCLRGPDFVDESTVAIGCDCNAVRVSADGGKSWGALNADSYPIVSMVDADSGFLAKKFAIVWISKGMDSPARIPRAEGAGPVVCMSALDGQNLVMLDGMGSLCVTSDAGQTWIKRSPIVLEDKTPVFMESITSIRFKSPAEGMVVTFDSKNQEWLVISTADGGQAWSAETLVKLNFGYSFVSRDMSFITLTPTVGDNKIIVFKRK